MFGKWEVADVDCKDISLQDCELFFSGQQLRIASPLVVCLWLTGLGRPARHSNPKRSLRTSHRWPICKQAIPKSNHADSRAISMRVSGRPALRSLFRDLNIFYFACSLMMNGRNNGKKQMAVRIVQHAFEIVHLLTDSNPIQVLVDAIVNTGPREDSTRIGSAGTVRRQAVDVSPLRRVNQSIALITIGVRESSFRNVKSISVR